MESRVPHRHLEQNSGGPENSAGLLWFSFSVFLKAELLPILWKQQVKPTGDVGMCPLGAVGKAGAVRLIESGFMEKPPLRMATAPSTAPWLYSEAHRNLSTFTSLWDSCCSSWSQLPLQSVSLSSPPLHLQVADLGSHVLLQCCPHLLSGSTGAPHLRQDFRFLHRSPGSTWLRWAEALTLFQARTV